MNKLPQYLLTLLALALPGAAGAQYAPSQPPAQITPAAPQMVNPFLQFMPGTGMAPVAMPVPAVAGIARPARPAPPQPGL
jgi:hypothetical protein